MTGEDLYNYVDITKYCNSCDSPNSGTETMGTILADRCPMSDPDGSPCIMYGNCGMLNSGASKKILKICDDPSAGYRCVSGPAQSMSSSSEPLLCPNQGAPLCPLTQNPEGEGCNGLISGSATKVLNEDGTTSCMLVTSINPQGEGWTSGATTTFVKPKGGIKYNTKGLTMYHAGSNSYVTIHSDGNIQINSRRSVKVIADGSISFKSGGDITLEAVGSVALKAGNNITTCAHNNTINQSSGEHKIKAWNIVNRSHKFRSCSTNAVFVTEGQFKVKSWSTYLTTNSYRNYCQTGYTEAPGQFHIQNLFATGSPTKCNPRCPGMLHIHQYMPGPTNWMTDKEIDGLLTGLYTPPLCPSIDGWEHSDLDECGANVKLTVVGAGTLKMYVDGELVAELEGRDDQETIYPAIPPTVVYVKKTSTVLIETKPVNKCHILSTLEVDEVEMSPGEDGGETTLTRISIDMNVVASFARRKVIVTKNADGSINSTQISSAYASCREDLIIIVNPNT